MTSYPTPKFRRTALAPSVLAVIVLLAGIPLLGSDGYTWIRYAVSILALIVAVFAWQARQWWWIVPLAAIAIVWNPVFPIPLEPGTLTLALQFGAAVVFLVAGALIRIVNPEDRNRR